MNYHLLHVPLHSFGSSRLRTLKGFPARGTWLLPFSRIGYLDTKTMDAMDAMDAMVSESDHSLVKNQRKKKDKVLYPACPMKDEVTKYKMQVEYDGSRFLGWQAQDRTRGRTVQGEMEKGLYRLTGETTVRIQGASRTDKGVHALGQVASFASKCALSLPEFMASLNSRLPEDCVIHSMEVVNASFDPRKNSIEKLYSYCIEHGKVRSVLQRHRVWFIKHPLQIERMRRASHQLVGPEMDFSSFTPTPKPNENMCILTALDIIEESPHSLRINVRGNRFLYRMVRNLVGTLVDVGRGELEPDQLFAILQAKDRKRAGQGAPAHGLTLQWIKYHHET